jgi:branched-chain amino acid transport system permease protein
LIWAISAVLLVGGFLVARKDWVRVKEAWDKAGNLAREEDVTP